MLPDGYHITEDGTVHVKERIIAYTNNRGELIKYRKPAGTIKPFMSNSGYLFISITSQHKKFYIHRLIAHYFIGVFTDEKSQVNHKNGIKTDNRIDNLEIVSRAENQQHKYRVLGQRSKSAILSNEQANAIRDMVTNGATQRSAAIQFGVSFMVVSRIMNNVQQAYRNE